MILKQFLGANKCLYNSLRLTVGRLVCLLVPTMKFLNLLMSKSGYVEIDLPSRLVWIIFVYHYYYYPESVRSENSKKLFRYKETRLIPNQTRGLLG
jgi:hypothetical protein